RPQDPAAVGREHHGTVHLGQLTQSGGGELDVEWETAGAQSIDDLVVAEHDQRAGISTQDSLEAVPQTGARCNHGKDAAQRVIAIATRHCSTPRGHWSDKRRRPVYEAV